MADPVVGPIKVQVGSHIPLRYAGVVLNDGTIITCFGDSGDPEFINFAYSDDDGATWTPTTPAYLGFFNQDIGYDSPVSFVVDEDDVLWLASCGTGSGKLYRGVFSGGTITWDTPYTFVSARCNDVAICAFKVGTDTYIPMIYSELISEGVRIDIIKRTSGGTFSNFDGWDVTTKDFIRYVRIDWNHTGDNKTPNGDPDWWYMWGSTEFADEELEIVEVDYSAGPSWATGSSFKPEDGVTGNVYAPNMWWDGDRLMLTNVRGTDLYLWELDISDMGDTEYSTSIGAITDYSAFGDRLGNIWSIYWDYSNMKIAKWDRKTTTFESAETLYSTRWWGSAPIPWVVASYPIVCYRNISDEDWYFVVPVDYPGASGHGFGAFG